jgi:hypothetical protein
MLKPLRAAMSRNQTCCAGVIENAASPIRAMAIMLEMKLRSLSVSAIFDAH